MHSHERDKRLGTTIWRLLEQRDPENHLHIVMYKNEQNWIHSMTRKKTEINGVNYFNNVFGAHTEEQMLRHYRTYYNQWLEFDITNKFILPYEEMLIDPEGVLEFISNRWDIPRKPFSMPAVGAVEQSHDLNNERIQRYIDTYRGNIS